MQKFKFQYVSQGVMFFLALFLSNLFVFGYVLWLPPLYIFVEAMCWVVVAALMIWAISRQAGYTKLIELLKRNWYILPFLVYSGISISWSVAPDVSFYRWLILLITLFAGAYFGLQYELKKIIEMLSIFLIYILALSTIFVIFVPGIGIMNYHSIQGAWKGIYWHKNHMGIIASLANLLFLINSVQSLQGKSNRAIYWIPLYMFSLFFIYQSDSVGAYMTTILMHGLAGAALLFLKFRARLKQAHYLLIAALILLGGLVVILNLDIIFGIFNRNTSLTGRVPLWTYLFSFYLSKKPLFGYGFNAFWYIEAHRLVMQLATGYPDQVIISDNGFIDILINGGFIGFALFGIFYLGVWWQCVKFSAKSNDLTGMFPVFLLAFTLIANLTWSLMFENEGFIFLTMMVVLFGISKESLQQKRNE